jgi:hypothetical protein
MKLFELLPCVDLPGQRSLTVAPPIDLPVKQALARLERRPSRQWLDATRDMETGHAVRLEVSLEELALLLERVDFSSGSLQVISKFRSKPFLRGALPVVSRMSLWQRGPCA